MVWYEYFYFLTFVLFEIALSIRVSRITRDTWARREMVDNLTNSIQATCSRTRIFTLIAYTSKTRGAIRIQNTFGPATFIRITEIPTYTCASTRTILFSTNSIWSTRTWWARISNFYRVILSHNWTLTKRITSVSVYTVAHRSMTNNFAFSIETTSTCTRIFALLIYAS